MSYLKQCSPGYLLYQREMTAYVQLNSMSLFGINVINLVFFEVGRLRFSRKVWGLLDADEPPAVQGRLYLQGNLV